MLPNRLIDHARLVGDDEIESRRMDVRHKTDLADVDAVHPSHAQHQWSDRDWPIAGTDNENVQLVPCAEALPPAVQPFVTCERMVDIRSLDEAVPHRAQ